MKRNILIKGKKIELLDREAFFDIGTRVKVMTGLSKEEYEVSRIEFVVDVVENNATVEVNTYLDETT